MVSLMKVILIVVLIIAALLMAAGATRIATPTKSSTSVTASQPNVEIWAWASCQWISGHGEWVSNVRSPKGPQGKTYVVTSKAVCEQSLGHGRTHYYVQLDPEGRITAITGSNGSPPIGMPLSD